MENKLNDASIEGNVSALKSLIQQDPLILDRISSLTSFHETALHVAILRGHVEFTRALLSHNPKLATESDSLGRLPLHVAAAKGHVEITRELLRVGPNVTNCVARDKDGMTPIHVAIATGAARVEVVRELTRASPESTRLRGEKGENVYHLCVKFNNLEALKVLVEELMSENDNNNFNLVINERDDFGNTIFHLAALHKHLEIIKYLSTRTSIDQNAVNKNGLTALDLVENSSRDLKGLEILNFLLQSNAQRANNKVPSSTLNNTQGKSNNSNNARTRRPRSWKRFFTFNDTIHLDGLRGELFVVSAIIVLITVLPVINMRVNPNGPILDDEYLANTLSLVPALSIMILLVSGLNLKNKFCVWLILQLMYTALGFLEWNYADAILSNESRYVNVNGAIILMAIWSLLLIAVSLLNMIRLIVLVVTTITGCVKRKKLQGRREDVSSNV